MSQPSNDVKDIHYDVQNFHYDVDFFLLVYKRRIVAASDKALTLDNGTVLKVKDAEDCCAWWTGKISDVVVSDAIITGAEEITFLTPDDPSASERFNINILSHDKAIASIDIEGSEGCPVAKHDCTSVTLCVRRKGDGDGRR